MLRDPCSWGLHETPPLVAAVFAIVARSAIISGPQGQRQINERQTRCRVWHKAASGQCGKVCWQRHAGGPSSFREGQFSEARWRLLRYHLHDFDTGCPGSPHDTGRAPSSREGNDEIGLAFVQHALITNGARLAAEILPVGAEFDVLDSPAPRSVAERALFSVSSSPMLPRALSVENIATSALFRTIEAAKPTLLLDEADRRCGTQWLDRADHLPLA